MSRKTLTIIIAVILAIAGVLRAEAGTEGLATALAALGTLALYIFFEARADIERVKAQILQEGRYKDPKFWLAIASAILAALTQAGINLPVSPEIIIAVLAAILTALFKIKPATD